VPCLNGGKPVVNKYTSDRHVPFRIGSALRRSEGNRLRSYRSICDSARSYFVHEAFLSDCGGATTPVTAGLLMKERRPAFLGLMPVGQD
jgi:hypothetical protein